VELVALLLGTGRVGEDALAVARRLLEAAGNSLRRLVARPPAEFQRAPGVGPVKAARLLAALELGHRLARELRPPAERIRCPEDVVRWVGPRLRDLMVEEFHVLALDSQSRVLRDLTVTRGILDSSLVHPREVFRAAIAEAAAGVILVHNHPSGDPTPSAEDRAVTRQLVSAGQVLDLPVYDHVIVAGDRHTSLATLGLL
jgi:DNA repair protein RadC